MAPNCLCDVMVFMLLKKLFSILLQDSVATPVVLFDLHFTNMQLSDQYDRYQLSKV